VEMNLIRNLVVLIILFVGTIVDIKTKKVPNTLVVALYIFGIIMLAANYNLSTATSNLLAAFIFGAVFLIVFFVTKGQIGMGDVKLISCIGLIFGLANTMTVVTISLLVSAAFGGSMILVKKYSKEQVIPFVPFLFIGVLSNMFLV
jgi:prepilin signal peptidase PulO-like enzyme (type II secretory pathway)